MAHYIDADRLRAEIRRRIAWLNTATGDFAEGRRAEMRSLYDFIVYLQQEQPELDLEKLGEIARHIIAVKQNVEDMRLNEDEWSLLERIGYPHKLKARKEDK